MLTLTEVIERGWTRATVKRHLGEPDDTRGNPQFRSGHPMKLYALSRVAAMGADPTVAASLESARTARIRLRCRKSVEILRAEQRREHERGDTATPEFVDGRVFNEVRHNQTNYDQLTANASPPVYDVLVRRFADAIVDRYPELAAAAEAFGEMKDGNSAMLAQIEAELRREQVSRRRPPATGR